MSNSTCNYCEKEINMKTDPNDTGDYYCSVNCFEKHLQEKARRKKQIIGSSVILTLILFSVVIFISLNKNWNPQQVNENPEHNPEQVVQNNDITPAKATESKVTVTGDSDFKSVINEALDLLKKYNYSQYNLLIQYDWPIQLSDEVEGNLVATVDQNKIIIYKKLTKDPKRYIPEQLAGIIVHQATHALSMKEEHPELSPEDYERIAIENEIAAYKLVGAPKWMLEEALARQSIPATYTVKAGDNDWSIAQKIYGDGTKGPEILEYNRETVGSGLLTVGQELILPRGLEQK